jgi:7-cyano-7-deazaguanine synthase
MRAVVLLSGGLDSVVAATLATREMTLALALTADYGQRAAAAEIHAARQVAASMGIPHEIVPLTWVGRVAGDALTTPTKALPQPARADLDSAAAEQSAAAVWVPNRNGLLINAAAVYAEASDCATAICGFNAEEAATFSDNSADFVAAANAALACSTRPPVQVYSPTIGMSKAEIVRAGREAGAPLDLVWSCYEAGPVPCLRCESCLRLQRALEEADGA